MPSTPVGVIIDPDGRTASVTVTQASGAAATAYTAKNSSTTHTFPVSVSVPTEFWLTERGSYVVSATGDAGADGEGGNLTVDLSGGGTQTVQLGSAGDGDPALRRLEEMVSATYVATADGENFTWDGDPITLGGGTGLTVDGVPVDTYDIDTTPVTAADVGAIALTAVGAAGGVASLDGSGKLPSAQLPATAATSTPRSVALNSLLGWSLDPRSASGSTALTAGVAQYIELQVDATGTLNKVYVPVEAVGSGLTAGLVNVYDTAGNRLSTSDDQAAAWSGGGAGVKVATLTTPVAVTLNDVVVVALLAVGTTGPSLARGATGSKVNMGRIAAPYPYAQSSSGQTALPSSVTRSGLAAGSAGWSVGIGA